MATPTNVRPAVKRLLKPTGLLLKTTSPTFAIPSFLIPAQQQLAAAAPFSSTTSKLFPRDHNKQRGVSTARHTGLRQPVSVSKTPLPKPVLDPKKRSKVEVDPDHGLWQFFHSKEKPMNTPEEDNEHGRPWCVEELRAKSWEDLHGLWWMCCKERNRIATEAFERTRLEAGYGDFESKKRDLAVKLTQRAIKQVLTERFYSWRDAETIAKDDPEIDLSGQGPVFTPFEFVDEEIPESELAASTEATGEPVKAEVKAEQRSTTAV